MTTSPSHPVLIRAPGSHVPAWRKGKARQVLRMLVLELSQSIDNDDADVWDLAFAAERAGVKAMEALAEDH